MLWNNEAYMTYSVLQVEPASGDATEDPPLPLSGPDSLSAHRDEHNYDGELKPNLIHHSPNLANYSPNLYPELYNPRIYGGARAPGSDFYDNNFPGPSNYGHSSGSSVQKVRL
ncbi:hypothetical protein TWF730_000926 [Orbilia blumenaviensis]|uniref:Uncharacterized protein n=1 Tax=Orbilia blumenaviensis TaxID=1796055 RepID=A0AAV9VU88_9PEZI